MKDVETWLPDGLVIACILERDDPRDAFLSPRASRLRRARRRRPGRHLVPAPGRAGADAPAGPADRAPARQRQHPDAQAGGGDLRRDAAGALRPGAPRHGRHGPQRPRRSRRCCRRWRRAPSGIECREADADVRALLAPLVCARATAELDAERGLLAELDGSCRTPIAALARINGDTLDLDGLLFLPDGSAHWAVAALRRGGRRGADRPGGRRRTEAGGGRHLRAAPAIGAHARLRSIASSSQITLAARRYSLPRGWVRIGRFARAVKASRKTRITWATAAGRDGAQVVVVVAPRVGGARHDLVGGKVDGPRLAGGDLLGRRPQGGLAVGVGDQHVPVRVGRDQGHRRDREDHPSAPGLTANSRSRKPACRRAHHPRRALTKA